MIFRLNFFFRQNRKPPEYQAKAGHNFLRIVAEFTRRRGRFCLTFGAALLAEQQDEADFAGDSERISSSDWERRAQSMPRIRRFIHESALFQNGDEPSRLQRSICGLQCLIILR